MADDPRRESNTSELPRAAAAFDARGADRDDDAAAVSRAAALLALVCPPRLSMTAFRAATYEAREILDVEPVEAGTDGRDAVEQHLL